jgi:hypothetical protein
MLKLKFSKQAILFIFLEKKIVFLRNFFLCLLASLDIPRLTI